MIKKNRQGTRVEFTLTDTGPLVALINANDPYYGQAKDALSRLPRVPLRTTWPCFTETMYLLSQAGGHAAQDELWGLVADSLIQIYLPHETEWQRMRELMASYHDTPMDLADASVVTAAEALAVRRVFTFDSHFFAYRTADGDAFEIIQ